MKQVTTEWNPELYNDKHAFVYKYGFGLVELLNPKMGEKILDVGCGSGQLTSIIKEAGAEVIGIDKSEEMIMDAKIKYPEIPFYVKDASDFQFDKEFDAVFSNAALHWMLDKEKVARSIYNNLKTGGRLVLEMGGKGNIHFILHALKEELLNRGYKENAKTEIWYFPSVSEHCNLLEKIGFEVNLAQLYDRPTKLEKVESGVIDWIKMFCNSMLKNIPNKELDSLLYDVQESLRNKCFKEGAWFADYRRLRIQATKVK